MSRYIVILGAGESGTGAALLAHAQGFRVFVSDAGSIKSEYRQQLKDAGIAFEEGKHTEDLILKADEIIKSPGIPFTAPIVAASLKKNIPVIDELEFASRYTKAMIIAVTGTNGKTTTTLLIYHLLKNGGLNVGLAGNVGQSLAASIVRDQFDFYVVEVSSFQIDGMQSFRPDFAVILNITPDHLDRYHYQVENYVQSKMAITKNMGPDQVLIYGGDSPLLAEGILSTKPQSRIWEISLEKEAEGFIKDGQLIARMGEEEIRVAEDKTALKGPHNKINMLGAMLAAMAAGVGEQQIMEGLATFKNAPHRLEYVGTISEVNFINDSKATNIDSVKYALQSFDRPLVWIAGGVDKGNDYNLVMESALEKVKALVCLGIDNTKLTEAFGGKISQISETKDMRDAVMAALSYAAAHDVVLLSPACASFDLFKNYEDRGNQFRTVVQELMKDKNMKGEQA